jgi:hypothetical protein
VAAAGRARVESFAWSRIAEEYRAIYRSVGRSAASRTESVAS